MSSKQHNWLFSKWIDLGALFIPIWVLWVIFLSDHDFYQHLELPTWAWFVFILGIDVGHVWSSLFRTYLRKDEFAPHKKHLLIAPLLLLTASLLLLNISVLWFWRVMAYLAIFHFIKQQYGFLMLYKGRSKQFTKKKISDKLIIYISTIYPIIFWHFNSTSSFNWFIENDFFSIPQIAIHQATIQSVFALLNWGYWGVLLLWGIEDWRVHKNTQNFSWGKFFWVYTTAINWWFGIVYFNSDLVFSISNVLAHGIPYITLVCFYDVKKGMIQSKTATRKQHALRRIGLILGIIFIAACIEEYFWDMFVYREHTTLFEAIYPYHWEQLTQTWPLTIAIALLALPQQIHYVMDGFIWKMNSKNPYLKRIFSNSYES